jgi:PST family polysaccharide transporter
MDRYDFEPENKKISQHVTSGVMNSGFVQIFKIACQFISIICLSRLLPPSDFGVIAMVSPIYAFIIIFHDLGLSQATIQKSAIRHEEVNAFFWLNIIMGLFLATLTIVLSPAIGWYYHDERVVPLTMAMGMLILVGALGTQHGAILQRRMQFSRLAWIDITGTASGLITSIAAALMLGNYWALYLGMAVAIVIPVTGVWIASGWRPTLPRWVPGLRSMLTFGAGVTGFNLTCFIAGSADNILIGRAWGEQELGLYDRAYKLLLFPLQRIVIPIGSTMIPLLSRLKQDPQQYRTIIYNTLEQLIFVLWPGIIWAVMLSDILIPTILGKNWTDAVPIFVPLGIASLIQIFNSSPIWIFLSQGRGGDYARWGVVNAVTSITAFFIGLPYGAFGVALAYAISEYIRTPFLWWYATRHSPVDPLRITSAILPHVISAAVSAACLFYFHATAQIHPFAVLACGLVLSYLVFTLTMILFEEGRRTLEQSVVFANQCLLYLTPHRRKQA